MVKIEEHKEHQDKRYPEVNKEYHKSEQPAKPKNSSGDMFWKVTTVALVVVLAVFAFKGNFGSNNAVGNAVAPSLGLGNPSPSVPTDMKALADDDPFMGKEDAPVTIVEFSDYECPFCARFYQQTLPSLEEEYIKTGKVKLVYRDFPLSFHPQAEPAAIAANCAGEQGKYFEYHDKIFISGGAAGKSSADYKKWAQELSLDVAEWEACTKDPAQRQEIQKDMADGAAVGVQGTPGFIINGKLVSGAQPFSIFKQVIDAELN